MHHLRSFAALGQKNKLVENKLVETSENYLVFFNENRRQTNHLVNAMSFFTTCDENRATY
jgi:hypothetical protein